MIHSNISQLLTVILRALLSNIPWMDILNICIFISTKDK